MANQNLQLECIAKTQLNNNNNSDLLWNVCWHPKQYEKFSLFASCGADQTIRIWKFIEEKPDNNNQNNNNKNDNNNKYSLKCLAILEDAHTKTVRKISWSPHGNFLAAASFDATVSIWSMDPQFQFDCVATLEGHENEIKGVAWDSSGCLLATCSRDKSVWIWEMEGSCDFECISVLHGHTQDVKNVIWHPSLEILVSCSYDDTIKFWQDDEDDWACSHTLSQHTSTVWDITFNKTGDRMASVSDDLTLRIWNTSHDLFAPSSSPFLISTISGHFLRTPIAISWNLNFDFITTSGTDDTIQIFQKISTEQNESYELILSKKRAHDSDVNSIHWKKDGNVLASCSDDGFIKLWKLIQ